MLSAVLVDDEALARERLRALLRKAGTPVTVLGEADGGKQAIPLIYETRPDLIFLDIQMPGLDGFEVVDLLAPPRPHVVFVTAYDEYALRAFETHALDYLTKPVSLDRLDGSLRRIASLLDRQDIDPGLTQLTEARRQAPLRRLSLQSGRKLRVVEPGEVMFFKAEEKIVLARAADGRTYTVSFTLNELEQRLDADRFLRIHRTYLVNVSAIRELVPWFSGTYQAKLSTGDVLPIARRRVKAVKALLRT